MASSAPFLENITFWSLFISQEHKKNLMSYTSHEKKKKNSRQQEALLQRTIRDCVVY